MAVNILIDNK